ncbi:hypothetical protein QWZ10_18245 [Paracoccus cavernae]|uniref:Uncharacterized protein n=1 Tax=Paracoccus cavernae TaxID=1571207 RepID=A0ABT8D8V6_9RHOB|nr:hypothetical protein [Paracoccus cavernae]
MDYTHIITLTAPQAAFTRNIADLMVVTSEHGAWLYGATHIGGDRGLRACLGGSGDHLSLGRSL